MSITREEVLEIITHELPRLLSEEPELRYTLIGALAETFARRNELHAVLEEIRALREDFNARFEEHSRRLEEHSNAIRQLAARMEEHSRRLEEHSQRIEEHSRRLEEHSNAIRQLAARIEEHSKTIGKLQVTIGGLGARWGLMSEETFRSGIASILADVGFQVERFWQIDTEGYVFGHPDQVEVDVAVHNGQVILLEIRSSVSRGDVTIFRRKVDFYEKVKNVKVNRQIIVSPFLEPGAKERAEAMGIEVYTSGYEMPQRE